MQFATRALCLAASLTLSSLALANNDSPVGTWKTIDDETKKPKSIVRITERDGVKADRIEPLAGGGYRVTLVDAVNGELADAIVGIDAEEQAAIDARMGEIYAGAFAIDGDGLVQAIGEEILVKPDALARPEGDVFGIGSGFATYGDVLSARLAPLVAVDGEALPHASAIAKLAARAFARGEAVDAGAAQPVYLRDKVALTLEEQGKSRG